MSDFFYFKIISVEIHVKNFIKKLRAEQIRPGLVKLYEITKYCNW